MLTFVDILNYWGLPESPGPARLRSPIFEPDLYHRSPWYFMVMDICVYGSLMSARDSYTIHSGLRAFSSNSLNLSPNSRNLSPRDAHLTLRVHVNCDLPLASL
jgi:hypothetical protein